MHWIRTAKVENFDLSKIEESRQHFKAIEQLGVLLRELSFPYPGVDSDAILEFITNLGGSIRRAKIDVDNSISNHEGNPGLSVEHILEVSGQDAQSPDCRCSLRTPYFSIYSLRRLVSIE